MKMSNMGHSFQTTLHLNSKISSEANKATMPTKRRTTPKNRFLFFISFYLWG